MSRDTRWGKAVKKEWFNICCLCGNKGLDPHHIFPRGIQATKYIIRNGLWLCRNCHDSFKWMTEEEEKAIVVRFIGNDYEKLEKIAKGYMKNDGIFEEVK